MVTEEEIRSKLSLDTSVLARAKRDIKEFTEHGHSGFVHAGNAARGFHKLLEQITEQSPVMGNALKFALSPIVGTLALATTAFAFVNKEIEKFNESLDRMAAKNAEALINIRAVNEALFKRQEASRESRQTFEAEQRAHQNGPIVEEIRAAHPGISDIALRALLIQRRRELFGQGVGQMGELDIAEGNETNPRFLAALEKAKQVRDKTAADLARIKPERSKALAEEAGEASSDFEKPFWWMDFLPFGDKARRILNAPRQAEREGLNDEFRGLTKELEKQDKLIRDMEAIDKNNTMTVKQKRDAIAAINKDIQAIDAELRKLPAAPIIPIIPLQAQPLDPLTGGYAYRGIENKGGVAYRPIRGAPGYIPPPLGTEPKKMTADDVTAMLRTFLAGANTDGVKIIVKDITVEK